MISRCWMPSNGFACPRGRTKRRRRLRLFSQCVSGAKAEKVLAFAPGRRILPTSRQTRNGLLAQLVERLNGIEEVSGSNPLGSTTLFGGPFLCGTAFFIYFSAEYVRAVRQLRIAVHTTVYKRAKNMSFESADAQICEMRRKALV